MAKQGFEWLAELSKEEQIEFCRNRVNHGRDWYNVEYGKMNIAEYLLATFKTFENFIDYAFDWVKTPEGQEYWEEIAYRKKD